MRKKATGSIPINIQVIKNNIQCSHAEFLKKFGSQIDKVGADHQLFVEITLTKIKYILQAFVETGIIDSFEVIGESITKKKIKLIKKGTDNYLEIITNGSAIIITGSSFMTILECLSPEKVYFKDVDTDSFDWNIFATKLLESIHGIIYERKALCEAKIDSILTGK